MQLNEKDDETSDSSIMLRFRSELEQELAD